jgi:glycosyltransferase involved in cell wall biosynthesis
MAAPSVSVVVPAFNVARYIGACLASLRAQDFESWECIVVDDGSTDGTAERVLAHADARVRLLVQKNRGVSAARNAGLAAARGEHVLFLDGDDLLHLRALGRLTAALDADARASVAYGTSWLVFEDGRPYPQKPLRRRRHAFPSGDVLARVLRENFLLVGATLVRTEHARALGGLDERLRLSEDWEFWCRLAARGEFRFVGAEPEVSRVRVRAGSCSVRLSVDWENHLPTLLAVFSNKALAGRFDEAQWRRLVREVTAAHLWEAGRVNFTARRFAEARRLMLRSLASAVTAKRLALFVLAQASQLLGTALVPRLRFLDRQDA